MVRSAEGRDVEPSRSPLAISPIGSVRSPSKATLAAPPSGSTRNGPGQSRGPLQKRIGSSVGLGSAPASHAVTRRTTTRTVSRFTSGGYSARAIQLDERLRARLTGCGFSTQMAPGS